jgi:O-antigen biosynthesis protein
MASGMATVSNNNDATTWLLRDGENCLLTAPLPTPTAERIGRLVEDPELRRRIAAEGLRTVAQFRWDDQLERVWQAMTRQDDSFALEPAADAQPSVQKV